MRKEKILLCLSAFLALLSTSLIANGTQERGAKGEGPFVISIVNRVNADVVIENNPVLEALEELTGYRINYEAPPIKNYEARLQLLMASGDIPQIMYNRNGNDYISWSEEGLLLPLEDYDVVGNSEKYPNINKQVIPAYWSSTFIPATGLHHAIPKPHHPNKYGMVLNRTWLEKIGLDAPDTYEEFEAVCEAFANNDPDGNGQDDTYAFTTPTNSPLYVEFLYGPANFSSELPVADADGEYRIIEKRQGYIDYLTLMRKAYANKWLDQEFFTNKDYADYDKYGQQRIGIMREKPINAIKVPANAGLDFRESMFYPSLEAPDGTRTNYNAPPVWGSWSLTQTATDSADKVLDFIEKCYSKEATLLLFGGIQGVHYNSWNEETRTLDLTKEQAALAVNVASPYMDFTNTWLGNMIALPSQIDTDEKRDAYIKYHKVFDDNVNLVTYGSYIYPKKVAFDQDNPDLLKKKESKEIEYVVGKISRDEFLAFLNAEWYPACSDWEGEYLEIMSK